MALVRKPADLKPADDWTSSKPMMPIMSITITQGNMKITGKAPSARALKQGLEEELAQIERFLGGRRGR